MATLTVANTVKTGDGDLTLGAAAGGGDVFPNDGKTYFIANNGSGGTITITFATPQTVEGLAVADGAGTVSAGAIAIFGPFPTKTFNNSSNQVAVTYSGVTSLTVEVFK